MKLANSAYISAMEKTQRISLAIVEDMDLIRENLVEYFTDDEEIHLHSEHASSESLISYLNDPSCINPDILLLDIGLPGMSGIEALPIIKNTCTDMDVIMLTSYDDKATILKALCNGAVGYLSKGESQEEIKKAIHTISAGGSYMSPEIAREIIGHLMGGSVHAAPSLLSERQVEIIERLSQGMSYAQIGEELFISTETVRTHIKKMYRTLEVNNKAEAIAMYLRGDIK